MDEILEYLTGVPAWYLATSMDGQPHVRPFSFAATEAGRLWFVTGRRKDVWEELVANPLLEACCWRPGHGWLVLSGKAQEGSVSQAMREAGFEHLVGLGEEHESADDENLVFFSVEDLHARIDDIDGSHRTVEL